MANDRPERFTNLIHARVAQDGARTVTDYRFWYDDPRRYGLTQDPSGIGVPTPAEIAAGVTPSNYAYQPGYLERIGGTVANLRDIATTTAVAGSKMRIERIFEASTLHLEDEAGIWSNSVTTFFGVSREFTSSDGTAGGPNVALFAFANNNNCAADVVAILGDAVARTNNDVVFGGNLIARNVTGTTGTKLVGLEIDVEPATGTTISSASGGLLFNIFSIATSAPVCLVGGVSGGTWGNGFLTSHITGTHFGVASGDPTTANSYIDTTQGTFTKGSILLGVGASSGLNFGGDAFGTAPYIYTNVGRDLLITGGTSGFIAFANPSGTNTALVDTLNGGNIRANVATAIPAGGANTCGFKATSTANYGVFFGSGAPTLSAAKGSLYLRSDGTTTNDRAYINTNGSTTWTSLTTAA